VLRGFVQEILLAFALTCRSEIHKIFLKDRKRGKDLAQFEIFHRTGLSKLLNNTTIHDLRETFPLDLPRFTPLFQESGDFSLKAS
jgi:hypothetical protein